MSVFTLSPLLAGVFALPFAVAASTIALENLKNRRTAQQHIAAISAEFDRRAIEHKRRRDEAASALAAERFDLLAALDVSWRDREIRRQQECLGWLFTATDPPRDKPLPM